MFANELRIFKSISFWMLNQDTDLIIAIPFVNFVGAVVGIPYYRWKTRKKLRLSGVVPILPICILAIRSCQQTKALVRYPSFDHCDSRYFETALPRSEVFHVMSANVTPILFWQLDRGTSQWSLCNLLSKWL